ncbi:putative metal-binding motif-containing protein [Sungkyunkwania multivorans]|uniref:Metal-binding motif-containing protein n=1 Tax=Sungkyunkwania multivorans TaxID=1173618 RepID=A0ABW3D259_9FLAO
MRNCYLLVGFFLTMITFAQTPEKINYSALLSDVSGTAVVNSQISLRVSILQGDTSGPSIYIETHNIETNDKGVVSFAIGMGTPTAGDFTSIDWSAATHYLQIEVDLAGGTNYTLVGTSELLSVPYALHAKDVDITSIQEKFMYYYADRDADGFGDPFNVVFSLEPPTGYITDNQDCNDFEDTVNINAVEICDGIDNNCDGNVDEGVLSTFFRDADSDGFGIPFDTIMACSRPNGYVENDTDCDDTDASSYPGAPEICDGKDNDCNGVMDEGVQNTYFLDADGDGFGDSTQTLFACTAPSGYVSNDLDCDDTNPLIRPDAQEVCNGIDDNCDAMTDNDPIDGTVYYRDADGDGFGSNGQTIISCTQPSGYVTNNMDCNDSNASAFPGAQEVCNGIDDNCDGMTDNNPINGTVFFRDADGDGFGNPSVTIVACSPPGGFVNNGLDCNDANPLISPAATELCDGIDNDCSGIIDDGDCDTPQKKGNNK